MAHTRISAVGAVVALVATVAIAATLGEPSASATAPAPTGIARHHHHTATLRTASAVNPTVHRVVVIGRTRQGRNILAYQLGDPSKPTRLVMATIHGNERQVREVIASYLYGPPVRGINLWVIEYANPDGWAHDSRYNAAGVDLNRNFPVDWKKVGRNGPAPASEPETRALMAFMNRINPQWVVSLHQPLDAVDGNGPKLDYMAARLSHYLELPRRNVGCSGPCYGTMTTWFNATHKGTAFTVELPRYPGATTQKLIPDGILAAFGVSRDTIGTVR